MFPLLFPLIADQMRSKRLRRTHPGSESKALSDSDQNGVPMGWREVVAVKIDPMKRSAADIWRDAMALPAEARAALGGRLRESVDPQSEASRRQFVRARRRAVRRLRDGLDLQWAPAASRDDLHRR